MCPPGILFFGAKPDSYSTFQLLNTKKYKGSTPTNLQDKVDCSKFPQFILHMCTNMLTFWPRRQTAT